MIRVCIVICAVAMMIYPCVSDVSVIYPDIDGFAIENTDAGYSTIRGDTGDGKDITSDTMYTFLVATTTTDVYSAMRRIALSFDTSEIPDNAIISSAILKTTVAFKQNGLGSPNYTVTGGALAVNTTIANGDYDGFTDTVLSDYITYESVPSAGNNLNFTFTADGRQYIADNLDSGEYTVIFIRDSWDIADSFTGSWSSGAQTYIRLDTFRHSTESYWPYLEIIYTIPTPTTTPTPTPTPTLSGDEISVKSYGDTYILWNIGNNTLISVDGIETNVGGGLYGQYGLAPGTLHIVCNNNETSCIGLVTKENAYSVFSLWLAFIVLIGLCVVSYYIPITSFPAVVYSMYLLTVYLPGNTNGDFFQYSLVVILMIVSILAAMVGWRRL